MTQSKCIIIDDDLVQLNILSQYVINNSHLTLVESFSNPLKAIPFLIKSPEIDLIFLDIEMPHISGLEFLDSISHSAKIILVSGKEQYAIDSYNYEVIDYLLKPISENRFNRSILKYLKENQNIAIDSDVKTIFVKIDSLLKKIDLADIYCIRGADDYIEIIFESSKTLVHSSLNKFYESLPKNKFIRVHRSSIVNIDKITKYDSHVLEVGSHLVRVSRTYKQDLINKLNIL
jgi:two-component system LytT family response regulator